MKYLRKIFTTMALMIIFSVSVFAKSGFEFHYNALIGVGVSFPTTSMKDIGLKNDIGFDGTGLFQIGYMRQVKEGLGLYLSYDIMQFINEGGKDEYGGTLNTGIVFGVKFGGKVD